MKIWHSKIVQDISKSKYNNILKFDIALLIVIFEDVDQKRLDFAVKCGATHTVLIGRDEKEEDVVPRVVEATGWMPDRTIECSGAQFSVNLAVHVNIFFRPLVLDAFSLRS